MLLLFNQFVSIFFLIGSQNWSDYEKNDGCNNVCCLFPCRWNTCSLHKLWIYLYVNIWKKTCRTKWAQMQTRHILGKGWWSAVPMPWAGSDNLSVPPPYFYKLTVCVGWDRHGAGATLPMHRACKLLQWKRIYRWADKKAKFHIYLMGADMREWKGNNRR